MKNVSLILILFLSTFATPFFAQDSKSQTTTPSRGLLSKGYIGLINEPLGFSEGGITGWILDDSPSGDLLMVNINLEPTNRARGLYVGLERSYKNKISWNFDLSYSFNKEGRIFTGNFGLGYRIGGNKFHLIPMLRLGAGNGNFKLGDIQNEDLYIQINETQFFGNKVEARLKDFYAYAAPELNAFFAINEKAGIQLSAGYKLAKNRKSKIEFTGITDTENSESATDSRNLNHVKNQLRISGEPISQKAKLVNFDGLYFKASFVKYLYQ